MFRRYRKIQSAAITMIITALTSVFPFQASAQETANLQDNQQQLQQMQSDAQGLSSSLQNTLNQSRNLEMQISNMMFQSQDLQKQISQSKQQINARNQLFKERLRTMYEDGNVSYLNVLLGSKDFSDFVDRFDMLTMIAQQDQKMIDELHKENQDLQNEQAQLAAQQQAQESKQQQLLAMEKNLRQQLQDKDNQIALKQDEIQQQEQQQAQAEAAAAAAQQAQQQQAQQPAATSDQQQPILASRGGFPNAPSASYTEMVATAYTAPANAKTFTGASVGMGTIAVDPSVIPLGTKLYIEGYGYGVATDTGLDIKGNRIDLFYNSVDQCLLFGRRIVKVYRVS